VACLRSRQIYLSPPALPIGVLLKGLECPELLVGKPLEVPGVEVEMFNPDSPFVIPLPVPLGAFSLLALTFPFPFPFTKISEPDGVELGLEFELEGRDR